MRSFELSLNKAEFSDFPSISRLLRSADLPIDGVSENIGGFLVARGPGGRLIGVAGLEVYGDSGLLRSVAVAAEHRGEGIGHLLVRRCIEEARNRGVRRLYLLTETAEKFMERFGFRRIDRALVDTPLKSSEEFKCACSETAVTMLLDT